VHAGCRQPNRADDLRALADASGGKVVVHHLDVTDGLQVEGLARELADEGIDILLNNAGIYGPRTGFGVTELDEWQQVLTVNAFAPLRMAECFVDHVARGRRKLIVNISSNMGSIANTTSGGSYPYRASKAALNMISKTLSVDLAGRGIAVVALHPGWVKTDMGGSGAQIATATSVGGLRQVIDGLTLKDSGRFFDYEGRALPW